ncbi:MAG: OmpA family protein, partial [Chloroflexota bacterium]
TDDIPPPSEEFPTNWELSTARATNVLRYLAEFGGIAPERLTAAGWGENKPIESNDTPQGRSRNRRAEIIVLYLPQLATDGKETPNVAGGEPQVGPGRLPIESVSPSSSVPMEVR